MRDSERKVIEEVVADLHGLGRQLNPSILHIRAAADKLRGLLRVAHRDDPEQFNSDLAAAVAEIDGETA